MEISAYMRFIAALVFVLALIGGLTWLARRFGLVVRATLPQKEYPSPRSIMSMHADAFFWSAVTMLNI